MINNLTRRLLIIVSIITVLVMAAFVGLRYQTNMQMMQRTLTENSEAVAKRVAESVKPTIWNIYNKSYNRKYTNESSAAILDAEMQPNFIDGIKVFGNFGHLYMGKIKVDSVVKDFNKDADEAKWRQHELKSNYPIKFGTMTIGHVEVSYNANDYQDDLTRSLLLDVTQVLVISFLFVFFLLLVLRKALVAPLQSLQIAQQALNSLDEAVFVVDEKGRIIDSNPSYITLTNYEEPFHYPPIFTTGSESASIFKAYSKEQPQAEHWSGDVIVHRKDGSTFPGLLNINIVNNRKESVNYVGVLSNVSEKIAAEKKLNRLAYFDTLTQIPNRHSFMQSLEESMTYAENRQTSLALLFIDLDHFKWTNDTYGHNVGDKLLIEIAKRLKQSLRQIDSVYRIGGDEFTVIVPNYTNLNALADIANRLIEAICAPLTIDEHPMRHNASIGISTYPVDATDSKSLIQCADAAMFRAKEQGRAQSCFFSASLEQQRQFENELIYELKNAILNQKLALYYQPKYALSSSEQSIVGAEALLRWQREDGQFCSPEIFIELAEQNELIGELGQWVITQACQQIQHWRETYKKELTIAVNLSARQFNDVNLITNLSQVMDSYSIQPGELEIEITERAVIENIDESIAILHRLQAMGISIAMDDFGTGYSSLSYLKQLPINVLKIDRSFIDRVSKSQADNAIVTAILTMAFALDLEVVAEGIETQEQLNYLIDNHCQIGQGYLLARPMPSDEFDNMLHSQRVLNLS